MPTCAPNTGVGQYGAYDGEEVIIDGAWAQRRLSSWSASPATRPPALSSNEAFLLDFNTGARLMRYSTLGDCQAIGAVGDTIVAGYHNNTASAGNPRRRTTSASNSRTHNGTPTTWDPRVNGNQGNADGGNNGIQAMYVDQGTQTLYLGGAFLHWNGTTGSQPPVVDCVLLRDWESDRPQRADRRIRECWRHHRDRVVDRAVRTTVGVRSPATP